MSRHEKARDKQLARINRELAKIRHQRSNLDARERLLRARRRELLGLDPTTLEGRPLRSIRTDFPHQREG